MLVSRARSAWARISSFAGLLRSNRAVARSIDDELMAVHGITLEQYEILSRIAHAPGLRVHQGDVSDPPLVTAANVERVLGELDRKRLVDRSDENGTQVVSLTTQGHEKLRSSRSAELDDLLGMRLASQ